MPALFPVPFWMPPWIWSGFCHWHAEHSPVFQTADILKLRTQPAAWMGSPQGQHTDLHANTQRGQFAVLDWEEHPSLWNTANTLSTSAWECVFLHWKDGEREGEERKDGNLCEIVRRLSTRDSAMAGQWCSVRRGEMPRSWHSTIPSSHKSST